MSDDDLTYGSNPCAEIPSPMFTLEQMNERVTRAYEQGFADGMKGMRRLDSARAEMRGERNPFVPPNTEGMVPVIAAAVL